MLQHTEERMLNMPYGIYYIYNNNVKRCILLSTSLLSRVTTCILSGTRRELVLLNSVMSVHLTVNFVSLASI